MTHRPDVLTEVLAADVLHLILLPTEACNFRCTYCYEDFRLGRMSEDVVRGVEALLSRRAEGLARLEISWFGGEPLAAGDPEPLCAQCLGLREPQFLVF